MGRPAGRIHLPKRTNAVRTEFVIHSSTQIDYFRPLRTSKLIDRDVLIATGWNWKKKAGMWIKVMEIVLDEVW
jgi:hypothetical protein